jgi:hypothetical protein
LFQFSSLSFVKQWIAQMFFRKNAYGVLSGSFQDFNGTKNAMHFIWKSSVSDSTLAPPDFSVNNQILLFSHSHFLSRSIASQVFLWQLMQDNFGGCSGYEFQELFSAVNIVLKDFRLNLWWVIVVGLISYVWEVV